MSKYTIISFFISFLYIYLGIKTLLNDHRNKLNILFSLICLSILIWTLLGGLGYSQKNKEMIFNFLKFAYIGAYLYYPISLHFYLTLSKTKTRLWILVLNYIPALILIIACFFGYTYVSYFIIYKDEWLGLIDFNSIWVYLFIFFILFYLTIVFLIIFNWGKRSGINKEKIYSIFILISYFITTVGSLILTILLLYFKIYDYQGIGGVLFSLYIIGLFYIIVRLRFMNINYSLMANEIISKINDIVILLDTELKVIDINNKYTEILSTKIKEIRKKSFFDLITENEYLKSKIRDVIECRIGNFNLNINYKKDKEYIITKSYFSEIKDRFGDLTGFLVISTEIKEVKQFQKYFKITNKELEIIELIISGFTYIDTSRKLNVTEKTIEAHLNNIYNKLNIKNKIDLIRISGVFNIKPYH